jgi:hypothetical protein
VTFWIDRPFAFLRVTTFRHYRTPSGRAFSGMEEWPPVPPRPAARSRGSVHELMNRLLRGYRYLSCAIISVCRRETLIFKIGRPFAMGERVWICTDVGSRTICAVLLDDLVMSCDSGPPYSVAEHVLDRYDMDGCRVNIGSRASWWPLWPARYTPRDSAPASSTR